AMLVLVHHVTQLLEPCFALSPCGVGIDPVSLLEGLQRGFQFSSGQFLTLDFGWRVHVVSLSQVLPLTNVNIKFDYFPCLICGAMPQIQSVPSSCLAMIDFHLSATEMQSKIRQLRAGAERDLEFLNLKSELKSFQNKRLSMTYQDLLDKKDTEPAGRFFLDQLYCTGDVSRRDHQVERVLPKLESLLPRQAVEVVRKVILMDLMAEVLDDDICRYINAEDWKVNVISRDGLYIQAYREQRQYDLRARQIELVSEVGESIRGLLRFPFLRPLLKMTRGAAQKANLEDFHDFLSQGIVAFAALEKPTMFFQTIQEREFGLLAQIKAGTLNGFPVGGSQSMRGALES
ncbi:MAG TPA: hypothetical protein VFV39_04280, partial [Limnobacter sp.]|nr:hypothetical protein [Limnobacter sp.]